jgi:uncharacterized membrane protein YGL010W
MRTLDHWLNAYGESHQNEKNKKIHWVCVPAIAYSILHLLTLIKIPFLLNLGFIVGVGTLIYYSRLSWKLMLAVAAQYLIFSMIILFINTFSSDSPWMFPTIVFIVAWAFQFWGHKIEGKKPSFLEDLQFLLIGPLWCLNHLFKKFNLNP